MTSGEPRIEGRRVTGARHQREGRPCQDAIAWARRADTWVLAVADGHGSSPRGGEGAQLAVEVAVEWLLDFHARLTPEQRTRPATVREWAREPFARKLVGEWSRRVRESVGESPPEGDVLRAHGTTLLAVLVAPEFVLFAQLGDGDILVVQDSGQVMRGVEPDERHFADETDSLCGPQAWLALRVAVWPRPQGEVLLLLGTDGYSNSFENRADFERIGPDYLARVRERGLSQVAAELEALLSLTSERGSGDDITLGMIHLPRAGHGEDPCE
ncbi:PP2C family serine/threonine-protein phosphatase [Archangium primigenium]|uniref:PP2C family serine/threonine-protein phosphatase n=1 Tax=[Archangium] primigenium TaxID=2792470 RepID=UPI00195951FD|nr:PP2C family serine/threonine-protein phosphatase [Archangium primigenium]MBM7114918.1 protein phosphatase 2C domain-containing protein [Archangium primigenium]